MKNMISAIQVILPVMIMLLAGILARKKQFVTGQGIEDMKSLLTHVCIPAVMFKTFYAAVLNGSALILVFAMAAFTVAAWLVGIALQKLLHIQQPMFPYLCTSIEGGMLGYALFILLFGQDNLYYMALLDLGNALVVFPFFLTKIRLRGKKAEGAVLPVRELATPVNLAIACGLAVNLSGLGPLLAASALGPVIDETLSFIGAPLSALILLAVGYGLEFRDIRWTETFQTIAVRAVIFAGVGAVFYYLLPMAYPNEALVRYSILMAFILPPTFMYSVTVKGAKESGYVGSVLAVYTLFSLAAFGILACMAAPLP